MLYKTMCISITLMISVRSIIWVIEYINEKTPFSWMLDERTV